MKLIVQPEDGIEPVLEALRRAKKSIHILIFRIDRVEVEKELVAALERGVAVQALIAYTNRGGDKNLRRLEMKLLEKGVTVTRTADDLVRYHGKMFIVDGKELNLLAFNYTHMDISMSRSFALQITDKKIVDEAVRLFECDSHRQPYEAKVDDLVVSPANARERLTEFIAGAKKQLLLYEMKVSDEEFLKLLNQKVSEGVDVRVIGRVSSRKGGLPNRTMPMRLHARAILRDGKEAFLGSQSLRKLELEARREVGVIVRDAKVVKRMVEVFDKDWREAAPVIEQDVMATALHVQAKKVAKSVAKQIAVKPVIEQILEKAIDPDRDMPLEPKEVAQTVREAFREEVQEAVAHALQEMVTMAAVGEELEKSKGKDADEKKEKDEKAKDEKGKDEKGKDEKGKDEKDDKGKDKEEKKDKK